MPGAFAHRPPLCLPLLLLLARVLVVMIMSSLGDFHTAPQPQLPLLVLLLAWVLPETPLTPPPPPPLSLLRRRLWPLLHALDLMLLLMSLQPLLVLKLALLLVVLPRAPLVVLVQVLVP